jgi:hypothetical protein
MVTAKISHADLYQAEFNRIYEDASYSAQTYYEASKSAQFWGRAIVYVPALIASATSLMVILGLSKLWSIGGVTAGIVSATSSFLGAETKSAAFRQSGNAFTRLRHEARLWRDAFVEVRLEAEAFDTLNKLRNEYAQIVDGIQLPSNRFFKKASRRIGQGILQYDESAVQRRTTDAVNARPGTSSNH